MFFFKKNETNLQVLYLFIGLISWGTFFLYMPHYETISLCQTHSLVTVIYKQCCIVLFDQFTSYYRSSDDFFWIWNFFAVISEFIKHVKSGILIRKNEKLFVLAKTQNNWIKYWKWLAYTIGINKYIRLLWV